MQHFESGGEDEDDDSDFHDVQGAEPAEAAGVTPPPPVANRSASQRRAGGGGGRGESRSRSSPARPRSGTPPQPADRNADSTYAARPTSPAAGGGGEGGGGGAAAVSSRPRAVLAPGRSDRSMLTLPGGSVCAQAERVQTDNTRRLATEVRRPHNMDCPPKRWP